jgi:hypothetical protein
MVKEVYLLIAFLVVVGAVVIRRLRIGAHQIKQYWGKMLITCPENQKTAAVEVATTKAAISAMAGKPHLELSSCTRWPEMQDCGQDCLCQIENDAESHRLWTIASRWFAGKKCIYCGQMIGGLHHLDHQGALRSPDRITTEWDHIPPEHLPDALSAADAVCWSCHVAQTFRRTHPEMVIERPWKH